MPLLNRRTKARYRMRLIFEPSSVKLYMRPCGSRIKPTTGLVILSVSIEPPDANCNDRDRAIDPDFPSVYAAEVVQSVRVMKIIITDLACAPSWKPIDPAIALYRPAGLPPMRSSLAARDDCGAYNSRPTIAPVCKRA